MLDCAPQELAKGATWTVTIVGSGRSGVHGHVDRESGRRDRDDARTDRRDSANSDDATMTTEQMADLASARRRPRTRSSPASRSRGRSRSTTTAHRLLRTCRSPMRCRPGSSVRQRSQATARPSLYDPDDRRRIVGGRSRSRPDRRRLRGVDDHQHGDRHLADRPDRSTSTVTSGVRRVADLSIAKTADPTPATAGRRSPGRSPSATMARRQPTTSWSPTSCPSGCCPGSSFRADVRMAPRAEPSPAPRRRWLRVRRQPS